MPDVLIATDADWIHDDVEAALGGDHVVHRVHRGSEVQGEVARLTPALVILDLQIGKMGGMATCLDLRLEEGAGRLPHVPVLMLLDRRADVFLARRSEAEGYIVKPLDPMRLSRAVRKILDGDTYEDGAYKPVTVVPRGAGAAGPLQ